MDYFFDSSALVKLFIHEPDSEAISRLVESTAGNLTCSALAALEVRSAIQRKALFNEISQPHATQALRLLRSEMDHWLVIPISDFVLKLAAQSIDRYALRALDAIQLGTALHISSHPTTFVTSDIRLLTAAHAAGLPTINPRT